VNEEAAGGGERSPTPAAAAPSSAITVAPVKLAGIRSIHDALDLLAARETPFENRAALYAVLYALQLKINRALRSAKSDLAYRMYIDHLTQAGQLRLKHVARKVVWPVNEELNWTSDEIQEALRGLRNDPLTRPFVRFIPAHLEINTVALAAALHGELASPDAEGRGPEALQESARRLYREMNARRWRRELEGEETIQVVGTIDSPEGKG